MGNRRHRALTKSIQDALLRDPRTFRKTLIGRILAFFSIYYIKLLRHSDERFRRLRIEAYGIDDEEYRRSFCTQGREAALVPMGDLGFSGSTFFSTSDTKYLVKSLPRHFEHSFFQDDLLAPYSEYMKTHRDSLLVRITDYLYAPIKTLGSIAGITPAHHIIMENVLSGKNNSPSSGKKWETYDLKPVDYFYPERDLVPEPLVSEDTLSRLADEFPDKIRLSGVECQALRRVVEDDTRFLQEANVVDYSLFLVRFPVEEGEGIGGRGERREEEDRWRVGVLSADGRWRYRAVVLDFFWGRHKLHAQAMTGVVQTFNVVGRQGPMSVTTTAEEYREKFLTMVESILEVV
ncbi:phosphatidylinositol phosphate kinase family protein [Aspergillus candidus]|uniref:SAICAR synthase-like protein n=1 Tax=Aspergillus candidus TaxID=41067 RepID=A0A2I2FI07_ASPCN|nr:SAICAR synthase-like protein [Aspergillus candidus]PLB40268.1 SAICAR synthase-like protein [Aspergillus candidus]